jgi:hypothetical protein
MSAPEPDLLSEPVPQEWADWLGSLGRPGPMVRRGLAGGANNRVFRVSGPGWVAVAKHYFRTAKDPRDRLGAEREFYGLIARAGIHSAPQALAWSEPLRVGLFEFVAGRRLEASELTHSHRDQAIGLITQLNRLRGDPVARRIPMGSEACFSVGDHLGCVDRRLARLGSVADESVEERDARQFITHELDPGWRRVRDRVRGQWRGAGLDDEEVLAVGSRCLSPSDFGFHNVIVTGNGELKFHDFEYAGWDDPAKLICDFFCQPQVPAPRAWWDHFVEGVGKALGGGDAHLRTRARWLFPVYQLKWCCIMLNDFLRAGRERREFSSGGEVDAHRRRLQLDQARRAFQELDWGSL